MYNRNQIVENFRGLIGFSPTFDAGNVPAAVDKELSKSLRGDMVNELCPLFTAENFSNSTGQFTQFTVEPWVNSVVYHKGDVVKMSGVVYQALKDTTGEDPAANPASWKRTTLLSVWYLQKYDGAVLQVIDDFIEKKSIGIKGRELRGNTALFTSEGDVSKLIAKSGRFVGLEVKSEDGDISFVLQRIGIQITENINVPVYVRYAGIEQQIDVNSNRKGIFYYQDLDSISFNYVDGPVTIGYYEDDLDTASAVDLQTDIFTPTYRNCCGGLNSGSWSSWSPYISVKPVSYDEDENVTYHFNTNFGLNLVFSFVCDQSDLFIREKAAFIPALKEQLRIVFLNELQWNVRNNAMSDSIANFAFTIMNEWKAVDHPVIMYRSRLKALVNNFSGISKRCLPCVGSKYKSKVV